MLPQRARKELAEEEGFKPPYEFPVNGFQVRQVRTGSCSTVPAYIGFSSGCGPSCPFLYQPIFTALATDAHEFDSEAIAITRRETVESASPAKNEFDIVLSSLRCSLWPRHTPYATLQMRERRFLRLSGTFPNCEVIVAALATVLPGLARCGPGHQRESSRAFDLPQRLQLRHRSPTRNSSRATKWPHSRP